MPLPLSFGPTSGGSIGRAQNFSTSKLMQHTERAQATTSIGRALNKSANTGPTTSISHPSGVGQEAQTSALRRAGDKRTSSLGRPNEEQTEEMENNRYEYMMRQRMRSKRANRAEAKRDVTRALTNSTSKNSKHYMHRMIERHEKKHGLSIDTEAKKMMKTEIHRASRSGAVNAADLGEMEKLIDGL